MVTLACIRHGKTEWNLARKIQGRTDIPLCDAGRAEFATRRIPNALQSATVYTSPLTRAQETAQLLNLPAYHTTDALLEMHWGEWEGQVFKQIRRKIPTQLRLNEMKGIDFCPPGGESPKIVQRRLTPWLKTLSHQPGPVIAITHHGVMRALFSLAFHWNMVGECPITFDWQQIQLFKIKPDGSLARSIKQVPFEQLP